MFIIQWALFISNLQGFRARGLLRENACVICDFIAEIIFCWNHYRCGFLKSVKVSKRIISQIYIKNKNKNFEKGVFCKYLKCKDLKLFVILFKYFHDMPCYRTHTSPDSKCFLAMVVRRFTNALFNHFKAMLNISIN